MTTQETNAFATQTLEEKNDKSPYGKETNDQTGYEE
jgi:hypothetical protein